MYSKRALQKKSHIKHFKSKISVLGIVVMLSSILLGVSSLSSAQADTWVCPTGSALSASDPTPAAGVAPLCHTSSTPTTSTSYSCPTGYSFVGNPPAAICSKVYSASPSYSCPPKVTVGSGNLTGTLSADNSTCSYPAYKQFLQTGTCPNSTVSFNGSTYSGSWVGGNQCYDPVVTPAVYQQIWNPPVTSQVWHPAVTSQVWNPPVTTPGYYTSTTTAGYYSTVSTQVWHPAVTTTTYVPAVQSCYYGPPNSTYYCVTTTPAHYVTTTTPGYYTTSTTQVWNPPVTTQVYHPAVTTPGYYSTVTTPGYYTSVTTPGYYTNGPVITPATLGYVTATNAVLSTQETDFAASSTPSTITYSCPSPDYITGSGSSSTCTDSVGIITSNTTTYSCPTNYSPIGTFSTPQDCTISATPPTVPDPISDLSVVLTPFSDGTPNPNALTLTLTWSTPNSNGAPITSYNVYWDGPFSDGSELIPYLNTQDGSSPLITTGNLNSLPIQINLRSPNLTPNYHSINIVPGEIHNFWVVANNAVGSSGVLAPTPFSSACISSDAYCNSPGQDAVDAATIAASGALAVNVSASGNLKSKTNLGAISSSTSIGAKALHAVLGQTASLTNSDATLITQDMVDYVNTFLLLQGNVNGFFKSVVATPPFDPSLAWSSHSLYAWGAKGTLGSPSYADSKTLTQGPTSDLMSFAQMQSTWCSTNGVDSSTAGVLACENILDTKSTSSVFTAIMPFLPPNVTKTKAGKPVYTTITSIYAGKSPNICENLAPGNGYISSQRFPGTPRHELYSYLNGCSLPFVDCSGLVDTALTWAIQDFLAANPGASSTLDPSGENSTWYMNQSANFSTVSSFAAAQTGDIAVWNSHGEQHVGIIYLYTDSHGKSIPKILTSAQGTNSGITAETVGAGGIWSQPDAIERLSNL